VCAVLGALAILAPASTATSPTDRAAAHAYLIAEYEYARSVLANGSASRATAEGFARTLGTECPGVLKGAPTLEGGLLLGPRTARSRGEIARKVHQIEALRSEIARSELAAFYAPDVPARVALLSAQSKLVFSDPRVQTIITEGLTVRGPRLGLSAAQVCDDLRLWRASGFRTIPPQARVLEQTGRDEEVSSAGTRSLDEALKPYEGPAERKLLTQTGELEEGFLEYYEAGYRIDRALLRTLGIHERIEALEETTVAHGPTEAGGSFSVSVRKRAHGAGGCPARASVQFAPVRRLGILVIAGEGETGFCLQGSRAARAPRTACEQGMITVFGTVDPGARTARLRLSDGRTVTSPTYAVPAGAGGPARIYVQAVRGPGPIPVSLTEIAGDGRVLRTVVLKAIHGCRRRPQPPQPISTLLVRGQSPTGRPFAIVGDTFFDVEGRSHRVTATFQALLIGGPEEETLHRERSASPLSLHIAHACPPASYTIFYGRLAPRGVAVLARTSTGLLPLARVAIPARMHARGALVWGVFTSFPAELVVEGHGGRVLRRVPLAPRAREDAEFCEGYGEG
jgi:hypothetical protein